MTRTTTYVTCRDCGHKLTERRETAGEPAHYECDGCGAVWTLGGERWKPILLGRDIKGA